MDRTANYGRRVDLCALGGLNHLRFKRATYTSPAPSLHVDNGPGTEHPSAEMQPRPEFSSSIERPLLPLW